MSDSSSPTGENPKMTNEEAFEKDWARKCEVCGETPVVNATGLCGPCTWGEADVEYMARFCCVAAGHDPDEWHFGNLQNWEAFSDEAIRALDHMQATGVKMLTLNDTLGIRDGSWYFEEMPMTPRD